MISARFYKTDGFFTGFAVTGHAGYDDAGKDIVCASVTSAVQMAANGLTELSGARCESRAENGTVTVTLDGAPSEKTELLFNSLYLQLGLIEEGYPAAIGIKLVEV